MYNLLYTYVHLCVCADLPKAKTSELMCAALDVSMRPYVFAHIHVYEMHQVVISLTSKNIQIMPNEGNLMEQT